MLASTSETAQPGCTLRSLNIEGYNRDGDIIIGGIFPLYFRKAFPEASFTELPEQIRFETVPKDTFNHISKDWQFVGLLYSTEDVSLGNGIVKHKYKQIVELPWFCKEYLICYLSTVSFLTDKHELSSFFRIVPSDEFQSVGLARLVIYFGWIWVGLIAEDSDYGQQGIQSKHIIHGPEQVDVFHSELLHYVKNVRFKNKVGAEVVFDKNGKPLAKYDILNWQLMPDGSMHYATVGSIDFSAPRGQDLIINESAITWHGRSIQIPNSVCSESCLPGYRKATRQGQPICCFDCVMCSNGEISNQTDSSNCIKCPEDQWPNDKQDTCLPKTIVFLSCEDIMGATLAAFSIFCSIIPAKALCIFIKYRDTPIVKANNRELSFHLFVVLGVCFLCSLVFIGQPRIWTCILRQIAFGIIFALCVSCVLAKTIVVVIAFNATKPNSNLRKWVGPKLPNSIVFVCTVIQVIICIAWLSISPPFPEHNMKSQIGLLIIECNEGSATAFWCMLGYMGLLAIISFIVSFLARNLPDSFNETKFIIFSMLFFVTVWLAFIPAYLSTRGKYMVAVEIFAILASSSGLLGCIFFPKRYIILLRPEMNTKEFLLAKEKN
ncbi:vomeronasal type-2 receptor 26-like [Latimeria chalumnae]|uniref:vomeronasal type-2 receptor 26-like n=1 Tax=Latimeria chalumnae TaxID=7897 RepID=UPI0006D8FEEE|nr:PREDICTED: vomeronasal type-2 receptor 26-like [Latimeria chalumnae]|eukprot:XP_014352255.1 PREDICTED: vomeronasal type-2 receptor 26-like [Latimeria chalumnae]